MKKKLKLCPVCEKELEITRYSCPNCGTSIDGHFQIDDFANLTEEQLQFIKVFICCQGNIKEVEKELNISYPTVKNKLQTIKTKICPNSMTEYEIILNDLDDLEKGNIDAEDLLEKLQNRRK